MRLVNDDFIFKFENSKATSAQLVKGLCLNSLDVEATSRFYQKVGFTLNREHNYLYCHNYEHRFQLTLN